MEEQVSVLAKSYAAVLMRLKESVDKAKRTNSPQLLAVSKQQEASKVEILFSLGQKFFAENYLQGLEEKKKALDPRVFDEISWSFIGKLQSNKIKRIVDLCSEIQSLETFEQAQKIHQCALALGKAPFPVCILVNVAEEKTKAGITLEKLSSFYDSLSSLSALKVKGVMSIPPRIDLEKYPFSFYEDLYIKLRAASRQIGDGFLSLGMSFDLELAVTHGSNCVRVGTDLFGSRGKNTNF